MVIEDYGSMDVSSGRAVSEGKFVHIVGPSEEYLVLSPLSLTRYHAQIVARFSRQHDELSFVIHPSGEEGWVATPAWKVKGGGRYRLDRLGRSLKLWGASKAFGGFDVAGLQTKINRVPGWEQFVVKLSPPGGSI